MFRSIPPTVLVGAGMALAGGIVALSTALVMLMFVTTMGTVEHGGVDEAVNAVRSFDSVAPIGVIVLSVVAIVLSIVVLTGKAWAAAGLAIAAGCYLILQIYVGVVNGDRLAPVVAIYPIASALLLQTSSARSWYRTRAAAGAGAA